MKNEILDIIYKKLPTQEKKIKKYFQEIPNMEKDLESFLAIYKEFMKVENITSEKLANAYLEMLDQMMFCRKEFVTTGEYLTKSQTEAFSNTYDNEEVMTNYMLALALSQFIWKHHYLVFNFYKDIIQKINNEDNILEVGSGHGLFLLELLKITDKSKIIDVVDISKSSIRMTKNIIKSINTDYMENIHFHTSDINDYKANKRYNFITMGEVIEHVNDPFSILKNLYNLLSDDGQLFITTCVNCPAIDHVYHFKNIEEIKVLIKKTGFKIDMELIVPSEDKSEKYLEKFKVDIIYSAVLKKIKGN